MVKVAKKQMTDELSDVFNDMVDLDSDPSPSPYMRHTMSKKTSLLIGYFQKHIYWSFESMF